MNASVLQVKTGTFIKTVEIEGPGLVDITGWEIRMTVKTKDLTETIHSATTEGSTPEITIPDPSPTLKFQIKIDDLSNWPAKILIADVLFKLPDGTWWPSLGFQIDCREGVTQRV